MSEIKLIIFILLYVKVLTVIRDAVDSTPETDDNAFERFVTIAKKVAEHFLTGKRPK